MSNRKSSGTSFLWQKGGLKNMKNAMCIFLLKKHRNLNLFDFFFWASPMYWDLNWKNGWVLCPLAPGRYDVGGKTCNLAHFLKATCQYTNRFLPAFFPKTQRGAKFRNTHGQIPWHWPCRWHTMDACPAPMRQPRGVFLES